MMNLFQEGSWVWIRTGEPISFSAWRQGQPDDGNALDNENCLHLISKWDYRWNDFSCVNDLDYQGIPNKPICQKRF